MTPLKPTVHIIIVTGYSGAGKSTVLRTLEDSGFYCVDNLPIALLLPFYHYTKQSTFNGQSIALGIDVRSNHDMDYVVAELQKYKAFDGVKLDIFFLTASSNILVRRFQETRRKHPLGDTLEISQAIEQEVVLMEPLRAIAHYKLNTDSLTIHQLRNFVRSSFASDVAQKVMIHLVSFGFKYGTPAESNFIYDIRSLPNPYFIPELKILSGTDKAVTDYLFNQPEVQEYWTKLHTFVLYSLEKSMQEGRSFIKIAIGCTGGRHRSVAFVQKLADVLIDKGQVLVEHRDKDHDKYLKE